MTHMARSYFCLQSMLRTLEFSAPRVSRHNYSRYTFTAIDIMYKRVAIKDRVIRLVSKLCRRGFALRAFQICRLFYTL